MFPWEEKSMHIHILTEIHLHYVNSLLNPDHSEDLAIPASGDCWHLSLVFMVGNQPFTRAVPSSRDQ